MITGHKLNHSLNVARRCRDIAKRYTKDITIIDAAFVMGLLHDIGYENLPAGVHPSSHPALSTECIMHFLKHSGECLEAIRTHGHSDCRELFSRILNEADLTSTDNDVVTMEQRVNGIRKKFGEDDPHYRNATTQAGILKSLEGKDPVNLDTNYMELTEKEGFITGIVPVTLQELISLDHEGFLDLISERLTDCVLLGDISYEVYGYGGDTIWLKVTGDTSLIEEV